MSAPTKRYATLLFALTVVVGSGAVLLAQAQVIGPTDAIAFDYADADYSFYLVSSFEVSYDGAAHVALPAQKFQTVNGISSYKFVPPQTSGTHTLVLRACGAGGCGADSSPFDFAVLGSSSPPPAPLNIRKVPR